MSKKTAILAASFGTSFADRLELTIGAIEKDIAAAFPGIEVRRAFTSSVVRGILKESYGIETDGVSEAPDWIGGLPKRSSNGSGSSSPSGISKEE